jgi:hypothetical protein
MPSKLPPHSKIKISPSGDKVFVWLFFGGPIVIAIVAVNTGYFFGSFFIGTAALFSIPLIVAIRKGTDVGAIFVMSAATMILVGLGLLFIIPWSNTNSGPGLTNDDRYQKLLGESAYSCQAGHYDEQNCRAQRQGLDDVAKWLNEQKR